MSGDPDSDGRVVAQNRRARHDYFILETFEAGLVLSGTEVKSLRQGKASLASGCKMANDAARQSMAAYGCQW